MAVAPRIRFCRCGSKTAATPVDGGRWACPDCGELVLDPVAAAIIASQRAILGRLQRLEDALAADSEAVAQDTKLIDAAELARRLGRSRGWCYDNADRLGAIRVGDGPRPRVMFDPEIARQKLAALAGHKRQPEPVKRQRRRRRTTETKLLPIKAA